MDAADTRPSCVAPDVVLGRNVTLHAYVNLYGCRIGNDTRIGAFVEIQRGVVIGMRCKVSSHSFVCEGVTVENDVFIGHGVCFTNDPWPRATTPGGTPQEAGDWTCRPTRVEEGASIGSGATILCGITIGAHAMVGAGSVVTRDVPPYTLVVGNPARTVRTVHDRRVSPE